MICHLYCHRIWNNVRLNNETTRIFSSDSRITNYCETQFRDQTMNLPCIVQHGKPKIGAIESNELVVDDNHKQENIWKKKKKSKKPGVH